MFCKLPLKVAETGKTGLQFQADILRRLITFEVSKHKEDHQWDLDEIGVFELISDYLLLRDFDIGTHTNLANSILQLYGEAFFEPKQLEELLKLHKSEEPPTEEIRQKIREAVSPFCYFAASIWQALQKDENPLSPRDAYWLGAVDELYDTTLPCKRQVAEEDEPNQPNLGSSASTAQAIPSSQSRT